MDCIFCKIAAKDIPSGVITEDEHAFVFLDSHPIAPGHTIVIPKQHAATILDLERSQIDPVFAMVQTVTGRLKEVLQADGFTIGINHGDAAGQTVKHLHVHVVPRFKGDGGKSIHSVVQNQPKEPVEELAKRLVG